MSIAENPCISGYADAADIYWSRGWRGVLPLAASTKWPPPEGFTGHNGADPSYPDICEWKTDHSDGNIALRMPTDVVGIDVDCYDAKTGAAALAEAEACWGALPCSYRTTSRDDGSGIRLFQVPPGTVLRDRIAFPELGLGHIELIQRHHRYAMVWPSIHDKTGRLYQWVCELDGSVMEIPPAPDDLPELPAKWVEALTVPHDAEFGSESAADVRACLTAGEPSRAVQRRLITALSDLCAVGSRHDVTRDHVLPLLRLGKEGQPGVLAALRVLGNEFVRVVTADGSRTTREARSEFERYVFNPRVSWLLSGPVLDGNGGFWLSGGVTTDAATASDEEFWDRRESLRRIKQFAQARMVGPWGVLGSALVRVVCQVPPEIRLPAIIGAPMSLNMFAALVGNSGDGKDGCEGAARDAVAFNVLNPHITELPLGSGEGIAKALMTKPGEEVEPVLFTASEIDTVAALFARKGATLEPELRKLYCGQQLGFTNAQKETKTKVEAHTYRAGLVVGVQPLRGSALLDSADGGTPQRFLWLPVSDPAAPDVAPQQPQPWLLDMVAGGNGFEDLEIPHQVREEIRSHRLRVLRREGGANPLDGHRLLCRLKVAAALMFLEGRSKLSLEDWELAGVVMAVSDQTRQGIAMATAEKARTTIRARARAAAEREDIAAESKLSKAKSGILAKIATLGDSVSIERLTLYKSLRSDLRKEFDPAIDELLSEKKIRLAAVMGKEAYCSGQVD